MRVTDPHYSDNYTPHTPTSTESKCIGSEDSSSNSMNLYVAFIPVSFKQSSNKSPTSFASFLILRCRLKSSTRSSLSRPYKYTSCPAVGKYTIWKVSKFGSTLHAFTSSNISGCVVLICSVRNPVSEKLFRTRSGQTIVSSVSFGHAATNAEVRGVELTFRPCDVAERWTTYGTNCPRRRGGLPIAGFLSSGWTQGICEPNRNVPPTLLQSRG